VSTARRDAAIAILKRVDGHKPQMREASLDHRVVLLISIEPIQEVSHLGIHQVGWRASEEPSADTWDQRPPASDPGHHHATAPRGFW